MIHFIHGTLSDVAEGLVVVEAAGVGYGIHVPATVIGALPPIGEDIKIYTYFSLTQNGVDLYGFLSQEDRAMFTMLLTVSGIGPKGALGILSALTPDDLRMAIVTGDSKAISRAPGVGNKTAQRVVLELKDKLDASEVFSSALDHGQGGGCRRSRRCVWCAEGSGGSPRGPRLLERRGEPCREEGRAQRRHDRGSDPESESEEPEFSLMIVRYALGGQLPEWRITCSDWWKSHEFRALFKRRIPAQI